MTNIYGSDGVTIQAFGQTWHFTPEAIETLHILGIGAPATLTKLMINLRAGNHLREGECEADYFSVQLRIVIDGSAVRVGA